MAGRLARLPLIRCRGRWSGLPLSLGGPPRQAAAQPPRSLHLPPAVLPCGPHRPESAAGGSVGESAPAAGPCLPPAGYFSPQKSSQNAQGAAAPDPFWLCGIHPKGRHLPGRYDPPGHPVPYCLPLPGFARARKIGQSLRLQNFPQRPHPLRQLLRTNITVHAVGAAISRPPSNVIGAPVANVPESDSTVGADAHIGPCRVSGLSQRARRLWKATCIAAPLWLQ